MWKKIIKIAIPLILCLALIIPLSLAGCTGTTTTTTSSKPPTTTTTTSKPPTTTTTTKPTPTPPAQNEIVIGASRDITGPQAGFQTFGYAPLYKAWADEINAAGGINIAGKKLTIKIIEYDDASDTSTCVKNIEKLCTQDKVDFLFGPTGTAMLFAAAPIANKYKKLMLCGEGGATTLEPVMASMPYIFAVLNYSNHYQLPVFCDLIAAKGAKTVYICFMNDLHGAEYNLTMQSECGLRGIQVLEAKSVPMGITDFDPIVKEAKELNPDVFCCFTYYNQSMIFMNAAIALDFNPKCILLGPGGNFGFYNAIYGAALEDVCAEGAWNRKSSPAASALADKVLGLTKGGAMAAFGNEEGFMDWWGAIVYQATLDYFKQALEKAASLDVEKILAVYKTTHFQTVLGDTYWDIQGTNGGGLLPRECYAGQIGQWQKGVFEVIDNDKHNTAPFVYPKPPWPKK
jgi:branched-chain amino acid transport system substrate-binding protein